MACEYTSATLDKWGDRLLHFDNQLTGLDHYYSAIQQLTNIISIFNSLGRAVSYRRTLQLPSTWISQGPLGRCTDTERLLARLLIQGHQT
jgi:hypothetical protein